MFLYQHSETSISHAAPPLALLGTAYSALLLVLKMGLLMQRLLVPPNVTSTPEFVYSRDLVCCRTVKKGRALVNFRNEIINDGLTYADHPDGNVF